METSRKNVFSTNLILLFVSTILSLLIGELVARNFAVVRNVGPSFTEYDPVYGKRHKKNFSCERITPEFTMRFTTNSLGFRGPEPKKFPDRGILFIGDSFTEGYGVNDGEEFPDIVRRELSKRNGETAVPVVNAGLGDIGESRWIKFLKNEGKRFKPRVVVVAIMDNDFFDNLQEDIFVRLENDSLVEHPPAPRGDSRFIQKVIETIPGLAYSYLAGLLRQASWSSVKGEELPPSDDELAKTDRLTYRMVDEILRICNRERWQTLVCFVGIEGRRYDELMKVVKKHNVQHINTPSIKKRPDLFYTIDGHWNAKGHKFVAGQVLDAIAVSGILQQ